MSDEYPVIPCKLDDSVKESIQNYIAELKDNAHKIGSHGLSKDEFWSSGIFRSAIESLRGSQSASMEEKRGFLKAVLGYLLKNGHIKKWDSSGSKDRHDYEIVLPTDETIVIEAKGCLDGNNTNIYKRPPNADEFYIWSLCQNPGADPRKNAWSGIHTRLSAEIIDSGVVVDGVIIWDMLCGTKGRPCPKGLPNKIGSIEMPAPCVYLFPQTVSNPRNNPKPQFRNKSKSLFLKCLQDALAVRDEDINYVTFETKIENSNLFRRTILKRNENIIESNYSEIKRSNK